MQNALRLFGVICIVVGVLAVVFEAWQFNQRYDLLLGLLVLLVAALSVTLAGATAVLGIVAAARKRQFGWLVSMIAAGLTVMVGPIVAAVASPFLFAQPSANPACQGPSETAPCQARAVQLIFQNLPLWVLLAAPVLVGVVALLYSFRLSD
jgi:hypothetical protein